MNLLVIFVFTSCSDNSESNYVEIPSYLFVEAEFGSSIDLENLANYANLTITPYNIKDNSLGNTITDKGATLGKVLFYDKNLSSNNTISCASCYKQEFAFSDTNVTSTGVNGTTGRILCV